MDRDAILNQIRIVTNIPTATVSDADIVISLMEGIVMHSGVLNKAQILQAIKKAQEPPSEKEQEQAAEMQQLTIDAQKEELRSTKLENEKLIAETKKLIAEERVEQARAQNADDKVGIEVGKLILEKGKLEQFGEQNDIAEKRLELQDKQVTANIRKANRS